MANLTRGERNCNPGNIERIAANKWQGRLSDAEYRAPTEVRANGGRFEVFAAVEWGIRALASLLVAYQTNMACGPSAALSAAGRRPPTGTTRRPTSPMSPG